MHSDPTPAPRLRIRARLLRRQTRSRYFSVCAVPLVTGLVFGFFLFYVTHMRVSVPPRCTEYVAAEGSVVATVCAAYPGALQALVAEYGTHDMHDSGPVVQLCAFLSAPTAPVGVALCAPSAWLTAA